MDVSHVNGIHAVLICKRELGFSVAAAVQRHERSSFVRKKSARSSAYRAQVSSTIVPHSLHGIQVSNLQIT